MHELGIHDSGSDMGRRAVQDSEADSDQENMSPDEQQGKHLHTATLPS